MFDLDDTDNKILEILKENGRSSYSDIAAEVNLSRVAVRDRINKMVENDVIYAFTIIINSKAMQKRATIFLDIEVHPMYIDSVAKTLKELREITVVSQHTGKSGLHVHLYLDELEDLAAYLRKNVYSIKGVENVNADVLIKHYKYNPHIH